MARTAIPINDPTRAGLAITQAAADVANGNYLDNPERCLLVVNNTTGSAINLTIQYAGTFDGQAVTGRTISCPGPTGTITLFGGFSPAAHYQDADQGRLYVDAASSGLSLSAVRFPAGTP